MVNRAPPMIMLALLMCVLGVVSTTTANATFVNSTSTTTHSATATVTTTIATSIVLKADANATTTMSWTTHASPTTITPTTGLAANATATSMTAVTANTTVATIAKDTTLATVTTAVATTTTLKANAIATTTMPLTTNATPTTITPAVTLAANTTTKTMNAGTTKTIVTTYAINATSATMQLTPDATSTASSTTTPSTTPTTGACPTTEWVDPDTPASVCVGKTDSMGAAVELVFSDEFNVAGRSFQDGDDPRWTAVTGFPASNSQVNAYVDLPMHATTVGGKLRLRADASNNNMEFFKDGWLQAQNRPYATPMLQTWNKFCFAEGVLELSAQLPGISTQGGLWPAFWVMGNLGRATAEKSTDRIWPFSYSHCPSAKDEAANQFPIQQQEINACRAKNWTDKYGLNPAQGRGAIEIDIVEAMPGDFIFAYKKWKVDPGHCPPLPADQYALLESPRPMVATSLQLAPGIPFGADQRPLETNIKHGGSQGYNCVPGNWSRQWYSELKQGTSSTYGTEYKSQPNVDFWGEYFKGTGNNSIDLQTDSLSSLNALPNAAYTGQHIYQMEWRAGLDGYVEFNMDGKRQFRINASTAVREHNISKQNSPYGTLLGRMIPEEPSYIMLNIDLSTRWGWPDCNPNYCNCCSDCRDPKCTTCYYPWEPTTNSRQWLAELCKTLPAWYEIDYVRLWQRPNNTRTSCSPKDYPTQGWIESHRDRYILPNMNEPLRPVLSGGHLCASDADCGGAGRGSCSGGICQCLANWTGPKCLVKRIGTSRICQTLEDAAVGGAACYTNSQTDCGLSQGHGRCVEVFRPGGSYAPNQTYQMPDGSWRKVGGGDGRCKCNAGWKGTFCSVRQPANQCEPKRFPDPAWMGSDLERFIDDLCNQKHQSQELRQACIDVLWKPHWEAGGAFSVCGSWLRAGWVAQKASTCMQSTSLTTAATASSMLAYAGAAAGAATVLATAGLLHCVSLIQKSRVGRGQKMLSSGIPSRVEEVVASSV